MATTTVYRFRMYDISTDTMKNSNRFGTRETIVKIGGDVLEDTAIEVEDSDIQSDIPGMTVRNYYPRTKSNWP